MSNAPRATQSGAKNTDRNNVLSARQPLSVAKIPILASLRADPALRAVLTASKTQLKMNLDQDNSTVELISAAKLNAGERTGSLGDLSKALGFRKFGTTLRKEDNSEATLGPVQLHAFRAYENLADGEKHTIVNTAGLSALKEAEVNLGNLRENFDRLNMIEDIQPNEDAEKVLKILYRGGAKIAAMYVDYYKAVIKGANTKGFIAKELLERGVPKFIFDKMARTNLAKAEMVDARRIFWPKDLKKGFFLTVREAIETSITEDADIAHLIGQGSLSLDLVTNAELLKALNPAGENITITSESDNTGMSLRNEKVLFSPPFFDEDFFLSSKSSKMANFGANPNFSSAKQGLRAILDFVTGFQQIDLSTSDNINNYQKDLVVNTDLRKEIKGGRNFFDVFAEKTGPKALVDAYEAHYKIESVKVRALFRELLPVVTGLKNSHVVIQTVIEIMDNYTVPAVPAEPVKVETVEKQFVEQFSLEEAVETADDRKDMSDFLNKANLSTEKLRKTLKEDKSFKGTPLGRIASKFVEEIRATNRLSGLAEPIKDWLQGFSSTQMQAAVVQIAAANLDVLLYADDDDDNPAPDGGPDFEEDRF